MDVTQPLPKNPHRRNWLYNEHTLSRAIASNDLRSVDRQLREGAPLQGHFRENPLECAVNLGYVRIACRLLEDPYQTVSIPDFAVSFQTAQQLNRNGHPHGEALVKLLSRFRSTLNPKPGPFGNTHLLKTLCEGRWDDARKALLINAENTPLDVPNHLGFTPRMLLTHLKVLPRHEEVTDRDAERILLYASALGGHSYFLEGKRINPLAIHSTARADGKLGPTPLAVAQACAGTCGSVVKVLESIGRRAATASECSKHKL